MSYELAGVIILALYGIATVLIASWTRRSVAQARRAARAAERPGEAAELSAGSAKLSAEAAKELVEFAREDRTQDFIELVANLIRGVHETRPGAEHVHSYEASRVAPLVDQMPDWMRDDAKEVIEAGYRRVHGVGGEFDRMWGALETLRTAED